MKTWEWSPKDESLRESDTAQKLDEIAGEARRNGTADVLVLEFDDSRHPIHRNRTRSCTGAMLQYLAPEDRHSGRSS